MSGNEMDSNILKDLAADRATQGLSEAERRTFAELSASNFRDAEDLELAAAELQLADISLGEPLPSNLRRKVVQDSKAFFPRRKQAAAWVAWSGWAVAAALLIAIAVREYPASRPPQMETLRQALLSESGTVQLEWTATGDPAAVGLTGNVVWNEREQRGYMVFKKLAANDRRSVAYQLWIFAENQDARFPADGGVFDIPAGSEEVIVPITPKIHVSGATMFAVTVERPGGVVVSDRKRIVSVAKKS